MSPLDQFGRWLRLKQYQMEVTFSVYIFTPVEKFIFYSVLFLLCSLIFIATTLYLPRHIAFLISRAYFYVHGDVPSASLADLAKGAASSAAAMLNSFSGSTVRSTAGDVVREL